MPIYIFLTHFVRTYIILRELYSASAIVLKILTHKVSSECIVEKREKRLKSLNCAYLIMLALYIAR